MKVRVLKKDIVRGVPINCSLCPVALALRRKSHRLVKVMWDTITVGTRSFRTPARVRRFIDRFDVGKPVKPFSFECQ